MSPLRSIYLEIIEMNILETKLWRRKRKQFRRRCLIKVIEKRREVLENNQKEKESNGEERSVRWLRG